MADEVLEVGRPAQTLLEKPSIDGTVQQLLGTESFMRVVKEPDEGRQIHFRQRTATTLPRRPVAELIAPNSCLDARQRFVGFAEEALGFAVYWSLRWEMSSTFKGLDRLQRFMQGGLQSANFLCK